MMLDRSGSMVGNFRLVQQAAEQFVTAAARRPGADRQLLEPHAGGSAHLHEQTATNCSRILHQELQEPGPTPLWNAIAVGMTALLHQEGRRVVLVFTDGVDSPASTGRPTSAWAR